MIYFDDWHFVERLPSSSTTTAAAAQRPHGSTGRGSSYASDHSSSHHSVPTTPGDGESDSGDRD